MLTSRTDGRSSPIGAASWLGVAVRLGLLLAAAGAPGWSMAAPDSARAERESCLSASGDTAVAACRRVLEQNPDDVDARLAMGEALTRLNRFQDAVNLLRQGLELSPSDGRIQRKLRLVESYLQEQKLIEERGRQPSQGQATRPEVTLQLERVRCTSLSGEQALKACEKALQLAPDDAALHRAKGDALLSLDLAGRAIAAYRDASKLDPSHQAAMQGIERAQARQKKILAECQSGQGESGLKACDRARTAGAADESSIQLRRGDMLLEMGRPAEAEQAFEAALKSDPANAQASGKLAALRKPKEPLAPAPAAPEPRQEAVVKTPVVALQPASPQPARVLPKAELPRRYSNVPTVAGVTH